MTFPCPVLSVSGSCLASYLSCLSVYARVFAEAFILSFGNLSKLVTCTRPILTFSVELIQILINDSPCCLFLNQCPSTINPFTLPFKWCRQFEEQHSDLCKLCHTNNAVQHWDNFAVLYTCSEVDSELALCFHILNIQCQLCCLRERLCSGVVKSFAFGWVASRLAQSGSCLSSRELLSWNNHVQWWKLMLRICPHWRSSIHGETFQ